MSVNHDKLIGVDDLRSIGQLLCQSSHAGEQLYKLSISNQRQGNEFKYLSRKIYELNFERRKQMAEFANKYGLEYLTDDAKMVKGNPYVYCQAKHAIFEWALAEEKYLGEQPYIQDPFAQFDENKLQDYIQVQNRYLFATRNMFETVSRWLGTEVSVCGDCMFDNLLISSYGPEQPVSSIHGEDASSDKSDTI